MPVMDIQAEYDLPPPESADPALWLIYASRLTDAERAELDEHAWLLIAVEHLGQGPIAIPDHVAEDPRLTARERFVLAALLEVARDVDITTADVVQAVRSRLFGATETYHSRIVAEALASLKSKKVIGPTVRGGFVLEAP